MTKSFWVALLSLLFIGCGSSNSPTGLQIDPTTGGSGGQSSLGFVVPADSGQLTLSGTSLAINLDGIGLVRLGENAEGGEVTLEQFIQQAGVSQSNSLGGSLDYETASGPQQIAFLVTRLEQVGDSSLLIEGSLLSPLSQVQSQDTVLTEVFQNSTFRLDSANASAPTGRIELVVTDGQGARLPGVTVELVPRFPGVSQTVVTRTEGRAVFLGLQTGNFDLTARLEGFETINLVVFVPSLQPVRLSITMQAALEVPTGSAFPLLHSK